MTDLHLSQYRIDAELGRGGMGIVYKATDTKLNRTVALKVLPASALASEDDRTRFFREAQAAAQLHHPNIATVFQIDEAVPVDADGQEVQASDGPRPFIAMEFVEGETLQEYIKKGPVRLQDAVSIAGQVAEALKEAHGKDIVHRDIKSANVMLTPEGVAKVLDFGLAKTNQSTMLTRMGSTLGTVAYMSPEQARGQEVDGRTDLYALGTMLYEMVAGRLPFAGDYEQAVLYSILNEPPEPLTALRTGVPMELERITAKLLAKEAEYRYQSAAGLLADLKSLSLGGSGVSRRSMAAMPVQTDASSSVVAIPVWVWGVVAAALLLGLAGGWFATPLPEVPPESVVRSSIDVIDGDEPAFGIDVSPDGSLLAFTDFSVVRVRDLQTRETWSIPDSDGAFEIRFNEDGTWLLLVSRNAVRRAPVRGGRPVSVWQTQTAFHDADWAPDETIVFRDQSALWRLPLGGGDPESLVAVDTSRGHRGYRYPMVTPDGGYLLASIGRMDDRGTQIGVWAFPSLKEIAVIDAGGTYPAYLPSGHLVYLVEGDLMGRPFDIESGTSLGPPAPLASDITGRAWGVSAGGLMVSSFQTSFTSSGGGEGSRLGRQTWGGPPVPLSVQSDNYDDMRLAADGRSLVAEITAGGNQDLWVIDIDTGVRNQLTFNGGGDDPSWISGADSVLYAYRAASESSLMIRAADGSGEPITLLREEAARVAYPDRSPDGSIILYNKNGPQTDEDDLWLLDLGTGETRAAVGGEGNQLEPRFSPNGEFFLYTSREQDGENHIIVQPTALSGGRWDVSRGIGYDGRWALDGTAIYYRSGSEVVKVDVATEGQFALLGNPSAVISRSSRVQDWALMPDGSGVVGVLPGAADDDTGEASNIPVELISNWFVEVEERAPHPER